MGRRDRTVQCGSLSGVRESDDLRQVPHIPRHGERARQLAPGRDALRAAGGEARRCSPAGCQSGRWRRRARRPSCHPSACRQQHRCRLTRNGQKGGGRATSGSVGFCPLLVADPQRAEGWGTSHLRSVGFCPPVQPITEMRAPATPPDRWLQKVYPPSPSHHGPMVWDGAPTTGISCSAAGSGRAPLRLRPRRAGDSTSWTPPCAGTTWRRGGHAADASRARGVSSMPFPAAPHPSSVVIPGVTRLPAGDPAAPPPAPAESLARAG